MKPHTQCSGGVVTNQKGQILLVKQKNNSWSFPKGRIKEEENALQAAKREIYEETGTQNITLIKELGHYDRPNGDDPSQTKTITLFLFTTTEENPTPQDPGIQKATWVEKNEVNKILTYPEDRTFFQNLEI